MVTYIAATSVCKWMIWYQEQIAMVIKMSDNNVQLKGRLLFFYLMERFHMTAPQAYAEMELRNQDMKEVELMFLDIYDILSADGNATANELRKIHMEEYV